MFVDKETDLYKKKIQYMNLRKIFTVVLIVSFCSLFFMNFFVEGFIITIAVIALPILLYWYDEINPFITCAFVSMGSPLFRMMSLYVTGTSLPRAFEIIVPEIFFYLSYGFIYHNIYYKNERNLSNFSIAIFLSDFVSNIVEISLRTGFNGITLNIIKGLAMIAATRMVIVIIFIVIMKNYKSLLVREEHEERYIKLMMLTSTFKSEIYFMEKNMTFIEDLMQKAYNLYRMTEGLEGNQDIKDLSLQISMDVHETKKDYIRVIQGLEDITEKKFHDLKMSMIDIAKILESSTKSYIKSYLKKITFKVHVDSNAIVRYHFYMMSVLRNLINNSIESFDCDSFGVISLKIYEEKNNVIIKVTDNGIGIKKRDLPFIFNLGFSSKYDVNSGDLKRGLGLSIVKGLVENYFGGTIEVESVYNKGTTFKIIVDKDILKGE